MSTDADMLIATLERFVRINERDEDVKKRWLAACAREWRLIVMEIHGRAPHKAETSFSISEYAIAELEAQRQQKQKALDDIVSELEKARKKYSDEKAAP